MAEKPRSTRNYGMFKPHNLTREIKEGTKKYLELEASILKTGWWESEPLICLPAGRDGKHVITKGHHRWQVAMKHKLPIWYVVDQQQIAITDRENSGGKPHWSQGDWIFSHLKDGRNPNYQILMSFHERTKIPMSSCIELYMIGVKGAYGVDTYMEVRRGTLRSSDTSFAEDVGEVVVYCGDLGIDYARKTGFVRAIAVIIRTKVVEIEVLKKRIKMNVGIMKRKYYRHDFIAILNEAYNYRCSPKVDLKTEITNIVSENKKRFGKKGADKKASDKVERERPLELFP